MKQRHRPQVRRSISIAQKIWFSLGVLILGYSFSMVLGFVLGRQTESRLLDVSEYRFPASQQSQKALTAFKEQVRLYNDAVLFGDVSLVESAKNKADETKILLQYILDLRDLDGRIYDEVQETVRLLDHFTSSAQAVYTRMSGETADEDMDDSLIEEARILAEQTEELLGTLDRYTSTFSLGLKEELSAMSDLSRRQRYINLFVFLGVVVSALTLISIIIARSITGPLKKTLMLEKAAEQSVEGIAVADLEGHVQFVNRAWASMHGYKTHELSGERHELFHTPGQWQEEVLPFNEMVQKEGSNRAEVGHKRKDGTIFPTAMTTAVLNDEKGRAIGLVSTARDITIQKQKEEELKRSKAVAEAANQAKSEFLANMSHEIRTPMNGIIGMTRLALDTVLTVEQREYLEMVNTSANSLLAILNDLLDLSKIEARKMELEEMDFDLRTAVERAAETVAVKAGEAGVELTCRVRPEVPTALVGDPGRLKQVLVNLLGNSIKFTEEGEVGIDVKMEAEEDSSVLLHFVVSDTGMGIPPDKLDTIFESFRQADGSITRKYAGTGLGLSISKQLVELMGGGIWVESEVGKGSTFHFTARFGLSQKEVMEALTLEKLDLSGLRVLIVDDNATNRLIFHEMTSLWGLKPTEVAHGEQALAELERAQNSGQPYQLVLLDLQMPDLDGFTVAQRIRENPMYSDLEIIMLTSLGMKGDAERCKEIGIGGYLVKPVKQSELLDSIMLAMGHAGAEERPVITRHTIEDVRRRLKILLAEDNIVNQKLTLKILEKRGHHVSVASNGAKAMEALTRERFDLILMDVQMPEMDGLEATRRIRDREKQEGGHIPIVAMTAHAMKGDRERCLAAGMDDYLSKPIKESELFAVIERLAGELQRRNEEQHILSA